MDSKAAFDVIWQAWREGRSLDRLPADMAPQSDREGYAIQAHFEDATAQPLYGWKIAATSEAGQKHINVPGPIAGRMIAEHVYAQTDEIPFGHNLLAVMEPEFAFQMGTDLPPKENDYTRAEVMAAVASLHPAIELPNTRFNDVTAVGAAQIAADAACGGTFVLGDAAPEAWRDLDLSTHKVQVRINGHAPVDGIGANVLGDPRDALTWLVNAVSKQGSSLRAGQVVTTGTCMPPPPMKAGDAAHADFGVLGQVSMKFAAS